MRIDYAPINLTLNDAGEFPCINSLSCDFPTYGEMNFMIYHPNDNWFLKFDNLPLVAMSVGDNLYKGITNQFEVYIMVDKGQPTDITSTNITNFYIGVRKQ